jgi:hypothetical protein
MKRKQYSESKIKTAQKFLSKYNLTINDLTEQQKKIVVGYTYVKKYFSLFLILLMLSAIVFSIGAFISFQSVKYFIGVNCDLSAIKDNDALRSFGKACFGLGFGFCLYSSVACLMLIYAIINSIVLRTKSKILTAFLPTLKQTSDDNENPSD